MSSLFVDMSEEQLDEIAQQIKNDYNVYIIKYPLAVQKPEPVESSPEV